MIELIALGLTGSSALASTTWNYTINSRHAAVIDESAQHAGFQIWGLGYARTIYGGKLNNVLIGDGACRPGSGAVQLCMTAPVKNSGSGHVIYGEGKGTNRIYSGYGPHEVIYGGPGHNHIVSAPTSSTIYGGNSGDTIDANQGATRVYAGTGVNTIDALSSVGDTVYCSGHHDTVYVDNRDHVYNCANVIYESKPASTTVRDMAAAYPKETKVIKVRMSPTREHAARTRVTPAGPSGVT